MRYVGSILLVSIVGLASLGCGGETQGQVLTRYADRFAELAGKIERLVASQPGPGQVEASRSAEPLDPPLVHDKKAGRGTCDIIHLEQVRAPLEEIPFDLRLGIDLHKHLMWTAPDGFMRQRDDAARDLASQLEVTLARPYVVVHRSVQVVLPEAVDATTYKPGRVVLEGFVLDLVKERVVASYRVDARTLAEATYRSAGGLDAMVASARSAMWTEARDQVKTALEALPSAEIAID